MNVRLVLHIQGGLMLFLALMLLTPVPVSLYYRDGQVLAFLVSSVITAGTGAILHRRFQSRDEMTVREGFAVVTFGWLAFTLFGALPYLFSGSFYNPVDACFEAMSGFTTVGASVMTDIEQHARSVLFWRAMTQWLGGMGIIVLGLAILPFLGVGGMKVFEAEAAGPSAERLTPRIQDTARVLWGVYAAFTALGFLFLSWGEMDWYDAVCHTFTALATGGFSTRNASLAAFSTYSQVVTMVLMVVGGTNFSIFVLVMRGRFKRCWCNEELRVYAGLTVVATAVALVSLAGNSAGWATNLRHAAFTVTSVITTTGFANVDYERWPFLLQGLLLILTFVGACAGSTAGGLKLMRVLLLHKHAFLEMYRLLHPRQVRLLKLDSRPVPSSIMQDILGFTVLYLGVFSLSSLLLTACGIDLVTASSGVIACLATVGPGLGAVGPTDNYAALPTFAKIVLCGCMLLGRLEISTVLILFFPSCWEEIAGQRTRLRFVG